MRRALLGLALIVPLLAAGPIARAGTAAKAKGGVAAKAKGGAAAKSGPAAKAKGGAAKSGLRAGKSGPQRGKKAARRGRKRRESPPQMPKSVELTAIDLVTGTAHVEVVGTTRPPVTQLFILTDQSGRRFVPHFAECHPPPGVNLPVSAAPPVAAAVPSADDPGGADGAAGDEDGDDEEPPLPPGARELPATTRWRCTLTIPRLYRRAPLASLSMEWGALRVAASDQTVQRLWGEARAAAPLAAIAERSESAPPPAPTESPQAPSAPEGASPPANDAPGEPDESHLARAPRSGHPGE